MATIAELMVRLGLDASKFNSGLDKAGSALEKTGKSMESAGKAITKGITIPVAGAIVGLTAFANSAEKNKQVAAGFDAVAKSAGVMGDDILAAMQKSSRGLISNTDLMTNFNLAASLVSKEFATSLPDAFDYLGKVSASTGQSMSSMLDSLVRGVGRLSPLILDNLGIQVDLNEAYEDYAGNIGKSVDELSKAEQQTAVMQTVMDALKEKTAGMSDEFGTTGERIKVAMENAKNSIGEGLTPALQKAGEALTPLIGRFGDLFREGGSLYPIIEQVAEAFGKVTDGATGLIEWLEGLDPAIVATVTQFVGFLAVLGPTLTVVGKLTTGIGVLIPKMASLATALGITTVASLGGAAAIGGIAIALAALIAAAVYARNKAKELAENIADVRDASIAAGDSFDQFNKKLKDNGLAADYASYSYNEFTTRTNAARLALTELHKSGDISTATYQRLAKGSSNMSISLEELERSVYNYQKRSYELQVQHEHAAAATQNWASSNYEGADAMDAASEAMENQIAKQKALEETTNAITQAFADITSLSSNMSSMIQYAYQYDDIQGQINAKMKELIPLLTDVNGDGFIDITDAAGSSSEQVKGLVGEIETLNGAIEEMANQAALNMLEQTLAIEGWTEAEAKLFFDTAVAMGTMTREGADAAYNNFKASIELMNLLELDPKTGEITIDDYDAMMAILAIDNLSIAEKVAMIKALLEGESEVKSKLDSLAISRTATVSVMYNVGDIPAMYRAEGGPVRRDKLYIVGERGPEFFVPNTDGEIIPNHKLSDLTSSALPQSQGTTTPSGNVYNYNLTMPTSSNPADIKTAFELMEAWNA